MGFGINRRDDCGYDNGLRENNFDWIIIWIVITVIILLLLQLI